MNQALRTLFLLAVLLIAAQGIYYLTGAGRALETLSAAAFAEQRNKIDRIIAGRYRIIYYTALILGIIQLIVFAKQWSSMNYLCIAGATLLILADVILALKFSIPINQQYAAYPSATVQWQELQHTWIKMMYIRGSLAIAALLLLLFSRS